MFRFAESKLVKFTEPGYDKKAESVLIAHGCLLSMCIVHVLVTLSDRTVFCLDLFSEKFIVEEISIVTALTQNFSLCRSEIFRRFVTVLLVSAMCINQKSLLRCLSCGPILFVHVSEDLLVFSIDCRRYSYTNRAQFFFKG